MKSLMKDINKYEESSDQSRCDKGIAWMKSCRECLFEVLCKFNSFYQKKNDNKQWKENKMWGFHKSDGVH